MSRELLRQRMTGILRSAPCQRVDFRIGRFRVHPSGYERVAKLLEVKAIKIAIEPDEEGASYEIATNTVYFSEPGYGRSIAERALIVHELTHALEDVERRTMGELELEVAAYVAGTLYARYARQQSPGLSLSWSSQSGATRRSGRAHGFILVEDGPSAPTRSQQDARLWAAADAAADSLAGRPGATLSAPHYHALARAVRDHEFYAGASDHKKRTFDGIR